ncbi:MAG: nucleoside-triphosphatase [Candidatus Thorarchaeota archaeon]|nr:nucleoside-triphosphatase [Candidatus Thorarchaeota archaeon]
MNILLTGKPGIGKSTIIQKVVESIGTGRASGFWTLELRIGGYRVGFSIQTVDGVVGTLAHVRGTEGPRVGKYVVSVAHIDEVAIPAMQRARNSDCTIIIDEIASMELKSAAFAPEVRKCLDTGRVLGTLQLRQGEFQDEVRSRPDVRIINVTLENRDVLPTQILSLI